MKSGCEEERECGSEHKIHYSSGCEESCSIIHPVSAEELERYTQLKGHPGFKQELGPVQS